MTRAERAESIREFDTPSPPGRWRAMTPAERKRWEQLKRKPGRPQIGKGAAVVSVSIERDLLTRTDKLAKKLKVSRARLISEGLRHILSKTAPPASPTRRTRRKAA